MLRRALLTITAASTGLSAGAMLFIRVALLPFWQGSPPHEFRAWFAAHSERIRSLMVPLGAAAAGTAATTALAQAATGDDGRTSAAVAALSAAGVGVVTYAVNEPANHQLVREDLDDDETARLLHRWARWHDVRVVLGLVGALAAARTASRS
ncbi:MAG: DUF1772 domain-containing protein [Actinomycetota bacterium]|nr:DUF1772 domain-containing protein [Actinomycetota bacterium]